MVALAEAGDRALADAACVTCENGSTGVRATVLTIHDAPSAPVVHVANECT